MTFKGHGKFGGKLTPDFQFSPEKNVIDRFCLKDKLLEQKIDTAVACPDTEGL